MTYKKGDQVEWNWGQGTGNGEIKKEYTDKTTLTIKGTEVTRDASKSEPAYLIKQSDGDEVFKSITELTAK